MAKWWKNFGQKIFIHTFLCPDIFFIRRRYKFAKIIFRDFTTFSVVAFSRFYWRQWNSFIIIIRIQFQYQILSNNLNAFFVGRKKRFGRPN